MADARFFQEAQRLKTSPEPGARPGALGTVQFTAACAGDAPQVLQRARDILAIINARTLATWPTSGEWRALLPQWFLSACAPSKTKEESDRFMAWWRTLPPEEQARVEREEAWSLDAWLYWMTPENRSWTWWDARAFNRDSLIIAVEVKDWPFPWGALRWLFRAAGAENLTADDDN